MITPRTLCRHSWNAGMMLVANEDLVTIARVRPVECERCDATVGPSTSDAVLFAYADGEA